MSGSISNRPALTGGWYRRDLRSHSLSADARPTPYARRMPDAFALVLHSHLPYVRGAGRWPHGEEWVHEAILGTYLPLLVVLHDLHEQGIPFRVTIGLTPPLLEQLADAEIKDRFVEYVDDQIRR